MFNPTRAHEKDIAKGQHKIRMGGRVPKNAVNLAYSYVTPLNPAENVQIADTSGFILENINNVSSNDITMWSDPLYQLRTASNETEIRGENFLVTGMFKDGMPLHYVYFVQQTVLKEATEDPDITGHEPYTAPGISITMKDGSPLPTGYKYSIYTQQGNPQIGEIEYPGIRKLAVYTNFEAPAEEEIVITYNPAHATGTADISQGTMYSGGYTVDAEVQETLFPEPAYIQSRNLFSVTNSDAYGTFQFYQGEGSRPGYSRLWVTNKAYSGYTFQYAIRPLDSQTIKLAPPIAKTSKENWFLRVRNGHFSRSVVTPTGEPQGYDYFIPEYMEQHFHTEYGAPFRQATQEQAQIVGEQRIKVLHTPLMQGDEVIVSIANLRNLRVKSIDPTTGVIDLFDYVQPTDDVRVTYGYKEEYYEYRGYWDEENKRYWYLDLNPGKGHVYTLYDAESDEIRDMPSLGLISKTVYVYLKPGQRTSNVKQVIGETLTFDSAGIVTLNHEALGIFSTQLYSATSGDQIPMMGDDGAWPTELRWEPVGGSSAYTQIRVIDPAGELSGDTFLANYVYTDATDFEIIPGSGAKYTLFHTFEEVNVPNAVLLGKVQVRPNAGRDGIQIVDTRSRGGGLLTEIGKQVIQELMPEGLSHWDIGYWDGEPYQENAVIIIRVPRYILREFGGRLTKQEVEASVEKHMAFGVLYTVEYLEESVALLEVPQNLHVEVVSIPKPHLGELPVPEFYLTTEG